MHPFKPGTKVVVARRWGNSPVFREGVVMRLFKSGKFTVRLSGAKANPVKWEAQLFMLPHNHGLTPIWFARPTSRPVKGERPWAYVSEDIEGRL